MSTTKKIRLIIIDNSEEDGLLILKRVEKLGYRIEHRLCTTKAELIDALKSGSWDLVISEYEMSGFDGRTALRLVSEITPDTPFILIAGPIGEELTVEMMNNGVSDYLLKDNLENLESVIERALNQSGLKTNEEIAGNNSDTVLQIIDKSLNEIYIFDAETFRITYANGAAIKNLGYSRDALLSRNYQSIALGCNKEKLRDILKPLEDSESDQVRLSVIHKRIDGRSYPMQMCFQLFSHHGSSCYSAIGFNLSDVMEGSKKLYEQKRLAEEYERISDYKSQFLANISHELRTPLNSILLITRLLIDKKSENLDAYQKKHISVIQDSAEGLLEMVNEILDLSKIEAGRMEVRVSETDIRSSVRKIEDLFAHVAASKGVELNVDVNNNVPQLVFTDRIKVEQILRNLLSNACKFTEEGYVSLTVEITESESISLKKKKLKSLSHFALRIQVLEYLPINMTKFLKYSGRHTVQRMIFLAVRDSAWRFVSSLRIYFKEKFHLRAHPDKEAYLPSHCHCKIPASKITNLQVKLVLFHQKNPLQNQK